MSRTVKIHEPPPDRDVIAALLAVHDGDDRCGCLRETYRLSLLENTLATQLWKLTTCMNEHPAGATYRRMVEVMEREEGP